MAGERGKNKDLIEAGNPRLLRKPVKNGTEYSLYLEYQMGYNRDNGNDNRTRKHLNWPRKSDMNANSSSWRTRKGTD